MKLAIESALMKFRGLSFTISFSIIAIECLIFGVFPLPFHLFFHKEDMTFTETFNDKPVFALYGLLPVTGLTVNCTAKLYSMRIIYKMKSQIPQVFIIERAGVNFINVLRTAFALVESKSVKNTVKSSVSFYAFGIYERKNCT
jgi:hypothetical protein